MIICPICTRPDLVINGVGLVEPHSDPYNEEPCAQSGEPLITEDEDAKKASTTIFDGL